MIYIQKGKLHKTKHRILPFPHRGIIKITVNKINYVYKRDNSTRLSINPPPHMGGGTIEITVKLDELCIQRENCTRLSIRSPIRILGGNYWTNSKIRDTLYI